MKTEVVEFLTTAELAKRWRVSDQTIVNYRANKFGPVYLRIGKGTNPKILYRLKDVLEFENNCEVPSEKAS